MILDRVTASSHRAAPTIDPDATTTVRSDDGHRLATDVYLPSAGGEGQPFTTLLLRTPYGKRGSIDRVAGLAPPRGG